VDASNGSTAAVRNPIGLRRIVKEILTQAAIMLATLAVTEVALRVIDFRDLRDSYGRGYPLVFKHDPELGWAPMPNSSGEFHGSRAISIAHNSLGLRDVELGPDPRPTVMVVGDSLVWGYDAQADERFTELLRHQLPNLRIVNAGIPGYGTDQEYLLLRRLWDTIRPDVVVLVFCTRNDRDDNATNLRYGGYLKPYLAQAPDGEWLFAGQPVPWSRFAYFNENALVHNLWVARAAVSAFVQLRYPAITVPDPTERLVGMMRDFVTAHAAKFLVGLQMHEPQIEAFLQEHNIRYTSFDGARSYDGVHWTPDGHAVVASRLTQLLQATAVADVPPDAPRAK
jgi:lysophospholipase L1-like esterase